MISLASPWRVSLLLALAALLYTRTLSGDFVLDDQTAIRDNPIVHRGELAEIFTTDYWAGFHSDRSGLYRPLTVWSFALTFRLAGPAPFLYHLANLLLHALTALALYACCRRCTRQEELAWWAALLFAVHPVLTEAVAGLVGRADILATLFTLLALHQHLRAGQSRWRHLRAGGALLAALASKESAIAAPGLLLLADLFQYRSFSEKSLYGNSLRLCSIGNWKAHLFYAGLVLLYLGWRHQVLGGLLIARIDPLDNPLVSLPAGLRLLNALLVGCRYLGLLVLPAPLCADYSFAALPLAPRWSLAPVLLIVLVLAGLALLARHAWGCLPWAAFGLGWLCIGLAPVANLFFPIGAGMAERLLYLPAAGFALALAAALLELRRAGPACRLALLVCMGALVLGRTGLWHDEYTLFTHAVQAQPRSARAWHILGKAALERGEESLALECWQQALEIFPGYYEIYDALGVVHYTRGDYPGACELFTRCLELKSDYPPAWLNLGLARYRLGQREKAREAFQRAISLDPNYTSACYNLGVMELEEGNLEEAVALFRRTLELDPDHEQARFNLEAIERLIMEPPATGQSAPGRIP